MLYLNKMYDKDFVLKDKQNKIDKQKFKQKETRRYWV